MKNRLRDIRHKHGLKQKDLAENLGLSRQTINNIERGRNNPSMVDAFKIASYFGMYIEDIFIYDKDAG